MQRVRKAILNRTKEEISISRVFQSLKSSKRVKTPRGNRLPFYLMEYIVYLNVLHMFFLKFLKRNKNRNNDKPKKSQMLACIRCTSENSKSVITMLWKKKTWKIKKSLNILKAHYAKKIKIIIIRFVSKSNL